MSPSMGAPMNMGMPMNPSMGAPMNMGMPMNPSMGAPMSPVRMTSNLSTNQNNMDDIPDYA